MKKQIDQRAPRQWRSQSPEVVFKSWGPQPDYDAIANIFNAAIQADGVEHHTTAPEFKNYYEQLPDYSPEQDAFFALAWGAPVGWTSLQPRMEAKGDLILRHQAYVLPNWAGKGISESLISLVEDRAGQRASRLPEHQTCWLESSADDRQSATIYRLKTRGYVPDRHFFFMVRSLSDPIENHPLPAGYYQRAVLDADLRPIWNAHNQAFQGHWGHPEPSEENFQILLNDPLTDVSLWQIAWFEEEVVGMVLNFVDNKENETFNRRRGYTEDIAVLKPHRQQGLAKALITQSMHMFRDMGMSEVALSVDSRNESGALRLYRGLGYQTRNKRTVYRKPIP